jgi:hypothetical protein
MFRRAFLAIFLGALLFVSPSPSASAKGAEKDQANKSEEQKREEAKPKAENEKPAREDRGEDEGEGRDGRYGHDRDRYGDGRYDRGRYGHGRYGYGGGYYYEEPTDSSHFHARMSSDQETKKGPAGGKGLARLDVDPYEHRVCYELSYQGIGKPSGAHIHRGRAGENGPVVVDLDFARNGDQGCVPGNPRVLRDMQAQPQHYYVNLHTAQFPDGAIRGQVDYPTG